MKVRKFFLENEIGQQFDMNNYKESCLLISPTELGYSYNSEFVRIGNSFAENNRTIEQKNPSGIACFKNYDNCKKFIDFIESSEKLKWVYVIPFQDDEKTFYRDVSIKEFQKTEKQSGTISCPIAFFGLSLWYEAKEWVATIDSVSNELRWDFRWDPIFASYDKRNIIFENKGHTDAPFKLELNGEVVNPKISILENEVVVKSLDLTGLTINEGEKFVYNTTDTEPAIYKESNGVKTNLFNFLNPNFINFYKLRKGVSKIKLEALNEITNGKLTIYVQYKAV